MNRKCLEGLETIDVEDFKQDYFSHTKKIVCEKGGISEGQFIQAVKNLDLKKTKEDKKISIINDYGSTEKFYNMREIATQQTAINKYGSLNNYYQDRINKSIDAKINKYGSFGNACKEGAKTFKKNFQTNGGVDNPSQLDGVKNKKSNSLMEHFGSLDNAYKIRNAKTNQTGIKNYGSLDNYGNLMHEKSKITFIEKYGVDNPFKAEEIKKQIYTYNLDNFGVPYACMRPEVRLASAGNNNSKPNKKFEKLLIENNINFSREFTLDTFIYDFKIENILIEIDPFATHNVCGSPYNSEKGLNGDYHQLKTLVAQSYGFVCIHIFDGIDCDGVLQNLFSFKPYDYFEFPRKYIFNTKTMKLQNDFTNDCVIIYDDGGVYEK